MKVHERFIKYVQIHTQSDSKNGNTPSTNCQFILADMLTQELNEMGIKASRDELGYVYAEIPATAGFESAPAIGFVAHMDTAPDFSGENVAPIIHKNYDSCDIKLPKNDVILSVSDFNFLEKWKGRTVITADGSTLLGADDKAGVAEIMTLCEEILASKTPHGKICIGFTPDEEIGRGADHFAVEKFGADFAYTVDGGLEGEINYENFNAAGAKIDIQGVSVHPGSAKNTLVNACEIAAELAKMLPASEKPEHTENYEGFFHLNRMCGDAVNMKCEFIIRDHDLERFQARKQLLHNVVDFLNKKYPTGKISLEITDSYFNMLEKVQPHMHLIDNAKKAAVEVGITPEIVPIRGGTDGARLSFMGLPCPNLGTGGQSFHGPYECISVEGMEKVVQMLHKIVGYYSEMKK